MAIVPLPYPAGGVAARFETWPGVARSLVPAEQVRAVEVAAGDYFPVGDRRYRVLAVQPADGSRRLGGGGSSSRACQFPEVRFAETTDRWATARGSRSGLGGEGPWTEPGRGGTKRYGWRRRGWTRVSARPATSVSGPPRCALWPSGWRSTNVRWRSQMTMAMVRLRKALALLLLIGPLVAGCTSSPCTVGTEGCVCTSGDRCDEGLQCSAGTCVGAGSAQPGSGVSGGGVAGGGQPGPGVSTPATMTPAAPAAPGMATVKLCNSVRLGLEYSLGGIRALAPAYGCSPVVGRPCVSIPAGPTPITTTVEGTTVSFGTVDLPAGKESIIVAPVDYPARVVAVPAGSSCSSMTYEQAIDLFPAAWPLTFEPFVNGDVAFVKPAGWQLVASSDAGHVFRPSSPGGSPLFEFQVSSQRFPIDTPSALQFLQQKAARSGWTILESFEDGPAFASATVEDRSGSPARFLEVAIDRRQTAEAVFIAASQLAASSRRALGEVRADYLLRNVVLVTATVTDIPASALVGRWMTTPDLSQVDGYTASGVFTGSRFTGEGMSLNLGADGQYQLLELVQSSCSGFGVPCIIEGSLGYWETGRYAVQGGVLTLDRRTCVAQSRDRDNVLTSSFVCGRGDTPPMLSVAMLSATRLRIVGMALTPTERGVGVVEASR